MRSKKREMKKPANRAKDFMTEGMKSLFPSTGASAVNSWWNKRAYTRATTEIWIDKPEGIALAQGEYPMPEIAEAEEEPLPRDEAGDENFEGAISEPESDNEDEFGNMGGKEGGYGIAHDNGGGAEERDSMDRDTQMGEHEGTDSDEDMEVDIEAGGANDEEEDSDADLYG